MEELDLKELFQIFWTKKIQIIIIVLISMIIGVIYTLNCVTPLYKSSTTLILGRINSSEDSQATVVDKEKQITQSEISINSSLVSTYSELIKSKSLIKKVKENLNTNISETDLRNSISVSRVSDTELIEITVTNINPYLASQIANEIAKVFGERIEEVYNISNVYIIDEAVPSLTPYNINHAKDVILFGVVGIILSAVYIVIYNLLDTTIKSSSDMEKITNIKNLIAIPFNNGEKSELITYEDSKSIVSEAFRTLRTNVQFSSISDKKTKTYLLTSCFKSEGKSYIAANLAITFAQAGKKVILIDSDMRRGRQAKVFNFPNECGLSNYISNIDPNGMEINYDITQFIKETGITNLNIITSGNVPPNPSELLASPRVPKLIEELKAYYDVIIFDGAPVLPITDSLILTRLLDSTILVARYNKTKKDDLAKAKSDIENVGGKIIGTCLNAVTTKAGSNDLNYYYYYGEDEEKTFKDVVKHKLRGIKKAITKLKKLPKINKKNSKKIRIIEDVQVNKKPVIKDVKRNKKDVVTTIIEEVGRNNNLYSMDNINKEDLEENEEKLLEELRVAEEKRIAEEEARRQEELRIAEEKRKLEESEKRQRELRRLEEKKKAEKEARKQEELRIAEEKRKAEEEARKQEELRIAEKKRKAEEEARRQEELRIAEEKRKAEEEAKRQEELRIAEEKRKAEEEARRQEELRIAEEKRKAEEEAKRKEELRIKKLEEKRLRKEAREQKIKDAIEGVQNKTNNIKEKVKKDIEERKIKKAEKKIKAMEEQAKLVKEKLQKAEEERNKMFGKRIMFEIDEDLEEESNSNKEENIHSDNLESVKTVSKTTVEEKNKKDFNKEKEDKMEDLYPRMK